MSQTGIYDYNVTTVVGRFWAFCSAVRRGTPLLCGAERGMASAVATLAGHEAVATKTRVNVAESPDRVS